jgi:hypothetical protein
VGAASLVTSVVAATVGITLTVSNHQKRKIRELEGNQAQLTKENTETVAKLRRLESEIQALHDATNKHTVQTEPHLKTAFNSSPAGWTVPLAKDGDVAAADAPMEPSELIHGATSTTPAQPVDEQEDELENAEKVGTDDESEATLAIGADAAEEDSSDVADFDEEGSVGSPLSGVLVGQEESDAGAAATTEAKGVC